MILEYLRDGDWGALRRILTLIGRLLIDTGGLSVGIRFGTGTVTFPGGSQTTNGLTVTHGLGSIPQCVLMTGSGTTNVVMFASAVGATTFVATGGTRDASSPIAATTRTFYYLVLG